MNGIPDVPANVVTTPHTQAMGSDFADRILHDAQDKVAAGGAALQAAVLPDKGSVVLWEQSTEQAAHDAQDKPTDVGDLQAQNSDFAGPNSQFGTRRTSRRHSFTTITAIISHSVETDKPKEASHLAKQFTRRSRSHSPAENSVDLILRAALSAIKDHEEGRGLTSLRRSINLLRPVLTRQGLGDDVHTEVLRVFSGACLGLARELRLISEKRYNFEAIVEAVAHAQEACALRYDTDDQMATAVLELACCLDAQHICDGESSTLVECIQMYETALRLHPTGHPQRWRALSGLGHAISRQVYIGDNNSVFERSIQLQLAALELGPHCGRPFMMNRLSVAWLAKYGATGKLRDLQRSEAYALSGLAIWQNDQTEAIALITSLVRSLIGQYFFTNKTHILARAASHVRLAHALSAYGDNAWCSTTFLLSGCLFYKFYATRDIVHLDQSILLSKAVIASLSPKSRLYQSVIGNLSLFLMARYEFLASEDDLEAAIHWSRRQLENLPLNFKLRYNSCSALAHMLLLRFQLRGFPDDMHEALDLSREACIRGSIDNSFLDMDVVHRRVLILNAHLELTVSAEGVDEMTRICRKALAVPERDGQNTVDLYLMLSLALCRQHDISPSAQHLDESVNLGNSAVEKALQSDLPKALYHLAEVHFARFLYTGQNLDIMEAQHALTSAMSLCRPGTSLHAQILRTTCKLLLIAKTSLFSSYTALQQLSEFVEDNRTAARLRVQAATPILQDIWDLSRIGRVDYALLLKIHLQVIDLLPRIALPGLTYRHHASALANATEVAANAASLALQLGQISTAIEVLEQGRAIFWAQALRLRTDFDNLPQNYRDELVSLSKSIEIAAFPTQKNSKSKAEEDEAAQAHRNRCSRMEILLSEVREMPGFERFLRAPSFSDLLPASLDGDVVVLIAAHAGCSALALRPSGHVVDISLPDIFSHNLEDLRQSMGDAMSDLTQARRRRGKGVESNWTQLCRDTSTRMTSILATLWQGAVKTILETLEIPMKQGRQRPRLWWCPTGQFAFLPIHAAGVYAAEGRYSILCSDYVVSSYTPSLSALIRARKNYAPISNLDMKALIASVPIPFDRDWDSLPGTKQEVEALKTVIPQEMLISLSGDDDGTTDGGGASISIVESNLHLATIMHLTSHGWQDPEDPLQSGFVMRDGMLTVERLMKLSLPKAFLAYLSACDTAKGDQMHPDQVIHLAAAMLFTGFRSVVATMWSIDEDDGIFVATEFHRQLLGNSKATMDADDVAYALDDAITKLRERDNHPGRWASYIHLGI